MLTSHTALDLSAAVLFFVLSVFALPGMYNNYFLNRNREQCRALATSSTSSGEPFSHIPAGCGYDGLPIATNLGSVSWWSQVALGTCTEYAYEANSSATQASLLVFAHTPAADYCPFNPAAHQALLLPSWLKPWAWWIELLPYWLDFLGFFCIIGFIEWLHYFAKYSAEIFDKDLVTTADFSVMFELERLSEGVTSDQLEEDLKYDLRAEFKVDVEKDVAHIELALDCSEGLKMVQELAKCRMEVNEKRTRVIAKGGGEPNTTSGSASKLREKAPAALAQMLRSPEQRMLDAEKKVQAFLRQGSKPTGHAFVTFQTTLARNRCYSEFQQWHHTQLIIAQNHEGRDNHLHLPYHHHHHYHPHQDVEMADASSEPQPKRHGKVLKMLAAREPDDVLWEHLATSEEQRSRVRIRTFWYQVLLLMTYALVFIYIKFNILAARHRDKDAKVSVLSAAMAGILTLCNVLNSKLFEQMTEAEHFPSRTDHETSLFLKLSAAYSLSSIILPLLIPALGVLAPMAAESIHYLLPIAIGILVWLLALSLIWFAQKQKQQAAGEMEATRWLLLGAAVLMTVMWISISNGQFLYLHLMPIVEERFLYLFTIGNLVYFDPEQRKLVAGTGMRWFINQSWFEPGGTTQVLLMSLFSSCIIQSFLRIFPPKELFVDQCWKARINGPASQQKLNNLLSPPVPKLGTLYAQAHRSFSLGLIVAQLTPIAHPITFLLLLVEFCASRFALSHVWAQPASVQGGLTSQLQQQLRVTVLIATLLRALTLYCSGVTSYALLPSLLSIGYALGTFNQRLLRGVLRGHFPNLSNDSEESQSFFKDYIDKADLTTFAEEREKGNLQQRYVCPKARSNGDPRQIQRVTWKDLVKDVDEDALRNKFNEFDLDGNGSISPSELRDIMANTFNQELTDEELDGLIKEADSDGNGEIDYDEFERVILGRAPEQPVTAATAVVKMAAGRTTEPDKQSRLDDGAHQSAFEVMPSSATPRGWSASTPRGIDEAIRLAELEAVRAQRAVQNLRGKMSSTRDRTPQFTSASLTSML